MAPTDKSEPLMNLITFIGWIVMHERERISLTVFPRPETFLHGNESVLRFPLCDSSFLLEIETNETQRVSKFKLANYGISFD